MKKTVLIVCVLLSGYFLLNRSLQLNAENIKGIAPSPVWDDGLAEIAYYDAARVIYGKPRHYEAMFITIKEPFDMKKLVKADSPYDNRPVIDVLKQNHIMEVQTDNYPYRYMATTFVKRDNPLVMVKETVSSQEWCGSTFHEILNGSEPSYTYHSYFDKEADGKEIPSFNKYDMFTDQLFISLRFLPDNEKISFTTRIWQSLVSNHKKKLSPEEVLIEEKAPVRIKAAGKEWECRKILVKNGEAVSIFYIAKGKFRPLIKYENTNGETLLLKKITRSDYWSRK